MKSIYLMRRWVTSLLMPVWISGMLSLPVTLRAQGPANTTTPIKHVVVIFQENVSFDHYFATYPYASNNNGTEPTFTPSPNTPTVNGLNGSLLTQNPNSAQPVRLGRAQPVICDQDHDYTDEQSSFDHGLMDKFVEKVSSTSPGCDVLGLGSRIVMSYYDGNTVTAMWNYAQNFALSDNSFGTTFGPSTPGALNLIAGNTTTATVTSGSPSGAVVGGAVIGDPRPALAQDDCTLPQKTLITIAGKNVGDLLNAKNVSWGWFQGGFKPSSLNADGTAVCATTHNNVSGASAGKDYIPHHEPFQYFPQTANPHHLPPTSVQMIGQTDQANHQYDVSDFMAALAAGNMPAVSYIKAPAYQDGHAGYSDPLDEQTFLVGLINSIEQSPFWGSTAIFIAYDDSDGFYDHVMGPIVSQSATSADTLTDPGSCGSGANPVTQGRCGYGPRLPLLAISPYARPNFVDHSVTDQSSILRFIEDNWGLGRLPAGSTDALAGSLNGMFNFSAGTTKSLILDPATGNVVSGGTGGTGGGGGTGGSTTTAVAGPQGLSTSASQIQLSAAGSTSADGNPLTYGWTEVAGGPSAAILGGSTATPTVQFSSPGTYTFMLTVTDDLGKTATATIVVNFHH